ncbi:MAG: glycosyltransferase [Chloroflexi bacterium]|nr:glycosyltransferase [Chloroflexota bacterium]
MDSKVSVIIPTYNRAQLIGATLASVLAQTFRDYEIIVVDDGSEDDTAKCLARFEDRITSHRIEHSGASAARNAGLEIARGEYIAFLDSDDLWEPRFLERMSAALDSASRAGFVYCDYATFDARGIVQPAYLPARHKLRGNLFAQLLESDLLSTGALMIRRECLDRTGGFDPALEITHDWDLWLRLALLFDAECVDEPLVRIRVDSDGLTRNTPRLHANNLQVLAKWRGQVDGDRNLRQLIRRNMATSHRALVTYFWNAHRPVAALEQCGQMLIARFR